MMSSVLTIVDSEAVVVNSYIRHRISTSVLTVAETTAGTWHYQCTVAVNNVSTSIMGTHPIHVTGQFNVMHWPQALHTFSLFIEVE